MISEFKIHKSSMLYDNKTGVIFEKPYNEFAQAHLNSHNNKYLQALQDILSKSAIDGSVVELSPDAIEQYFKLNGFTELILKTTDECNLRCKYCVYSDHYPYTSKYSHNRMSLDVAVSAADYYLNCIIDQQLYLHKTPFIAFYGGEPLLNFDIIKGVIEYIEQTYPSLLVHYTITTNGIMLRDQQMVDFLKKHNVIICVSIDGYKDNHDRNRLKSNTAPTYDEICRIIQTNFEDYPLIYSLCCIDYLTDLRKLYQYYMNSDRMSGGGMPHLLRVSQIFDLGTDYYDQFSSEHRDQFAMDYRYLEQEYIRLAKNGDSNWFLDLMIGQELLHAFDRPKFGNIGGLYVVNGCCIPGEKIYVYPDGTFGVCEKVGLDDIKIGDIKHGLDFKRISHLINKMNRIMSDFCGNCNMSSICSVCFSQLVSPDSLGLTAQKCDLRKAAFFHCIEVIAEIERANPNFFATKVNTLVKRNLNADITEGLLNIMLS